MCLGVFQNPLTVLHKVIVGQLGSIRLRDKALGFVEIEMAFRFEGLGFRREGLGMGIVMGSLSGIWHSGRGIPGNLRDAG